MDRDKRTSSQHSDTPRRKRVKRLKTCIIIFFKLNNLQKQIDILMTDRFGTTYTGQSSKNEYKALAATVYNSLNFSTGESGIKTGDMDGNIEGFNNIASEYSNAKDKKDKESKKNNSTDAGAEKSNSADNSTQYNADLTGANSGANTKIQEESDKLDESFENQKDFEGKQVYLTFDDGPSKYTEKILNILSDYGVKATFFVIGHTDEHSLKMYNKIVDQGHALGMHSYSHDYSTIYKSLEDFDKDFTKIRDLLYDTTGYLPSIYRFPGGSSSVNEKDIYKFIEYLDQKSVVYFDWNVVNGDATGVDYKPQELYDNVINGVKLHNRSIVLMHDTDVKVNTIESLEMILKTLTEGGAEILPLDESVTPIQQVK